MINIGTKIAEMRKDRGMTQEELADNIGISAQTISKWENSVNMPDLTLIPLIADIFNVTIDELFGINNAVRTAVGPSNFAEYSLNSLTDSFNLLFSDFDDDTDKAAYKESIKSFRLRFEEAIKSGASSAVYSDNGDVAYLTQSFGAVLKKQDGGLNAMLDNPVSINVLKALADDNVRAVFKKLLCKNIYGYSKGFLSKQLNIPESDISAALDRLAEIGLTETVKAYADDEEINLYILRQNDNFGLIPIILACAEQFCSNTYFFGFRGTELTNF